MKEATQKQIANHLLTALALAGQAENGQAESNITINIQFPPVLSCEALAQITGYPATTWRGWRDNPRVEIVQGVKLGTKKPINMAYLMEQLKNEN
jgi:hypothetical protein